ncbi:Adenylyl cyclase class-3/4/guanylyl cyclase [Methyloversatilis universalis FAM5]|uniref:Adenylyl cyclase class-3/4/guanylyl cyclase n=1 Tax=Methyloversatilis universalis (strain ATCC BAA-1314 / DSM 25237 / JCM 13912 / CCUG 52030 / FAM5) TaxID=1000565 RepID=F5RDN8_METUF|nr:adenylate/guanylate cyclase domain-containing protein [Methyloversatilis universalis]EGK71019.1 Adenylyl cyclase class-3/4/guanylyl cyclase [Methyloversatilis universalis FAM5]
MTPSTAPVSLLARLRSGGIRPEDSADERLNKSLLVLATGLVCVASTLWLAVYWSLGPRLSATLPFVYQLLLAGNLAFFLYRGNFRSFRVTQLGLFLFAPFAAQWAIGNFITASGILLWGLLAPIGAILCIGARESLAWFFAYAFLVTLTGFFDYYLADAATYRNALVPVETSVVFFALNFLAVSSIVFMLLRFAIEQKQIIARRLAEAHALLEQEQARSERLLLNILPGPVARRLKENEKNIADGFADVSVMFADIVNFTQVAAGMTPAQVFSMLNRVFSRFDEQAEARGLEKIKTIGDAYMVAGGLNSDNADYTAAIADLALEMRDWLRNQTTGTGVLLDLRIGIGTGPVVAGVVGKKKFIYDLWGDTVNLASRITTEGVPGMVQVDTATYLRLRSRYDFHPPQTLYLKGKGDTVVYRLIGRRADEDVISTTELDIVLD